MADTAIPASAIVKTPGFTTYTLTGAGADHGPIPLKAGSVTAKIAGRTLTVRSTIGTGAVHTTMQIRGRLDLNDATATMRFGIIDRLKAVAANPWGVAWATAQVPVATPVQAIIGAEYTELYVTVTGGAADALVIVSISDAS